MDNSSLCLNRTFIRDFFWKLNVMVLKYSEVQAKLKSEFSWKSFWERKRVWPAWLTRWSEATSLLSLTSPTFDTKFSRIIIHILSWDLSEVDQPDRRFSQRKPLLLPSSWTQILSYKSCWVDLDSAITLLFDIMNAKLHITVFWQLLTTLSRGLAESWRWNQGDHLQIQEWMIFQI